MLNILDYEKQQALLEQCGVASPVTDDFDYSYFAKRFMAQIGKIPTSKTSVEAEKLKESPMFDYIFDKEVPHNA